jgi:hypothetical protein
VLKQVTAGRRKSSNNREAEANVFKNPEQVRKRKLKSTKFSSQQDVHGFTIESTELFIYC